MELLNNIMLGTQVVMQPTVLFYCFLGVTLGTLIGVLPGIGPLTGISLLLRVYRLIVDTNNAANVVPGEHRRQLAT